MTKLTREFFEQPTLKVAQELLGKKLIFQNTQALITETEAYIGQSDPACHAARGKTKRTEIMFGKAGFSYVYLIYGVYHCLNFVTEIENFPAAVLIRGVKLITSPNNHLKGPGKLCKYLGITRQNNGVDIVNSNDFHVLDSNYKPNYDTTTRMGISAGKDKLWRYVATNV
jgi:DNA-3-methyladenine glycosylase